MPELVANCPRCNASKVTFDLKDCNHVETHYGWQKWFEAFCVCRHCNRSTVFILSLKQPNNVFDEGQLNSIAGSANTYLAVEKFVSLKDLGSAPPPEHLPLEIDSAFREGATCMATACFNAAATMFRLCIDHATKAALPAENENGLNNNIRRSLGLRLAWLFDQNRLPSGLRELSTCIKEDGNDGAHAGTLKKEDAEDIQDFTFQLLERLYTEPKRLEIAKERRDARRKAN